MRDRVWLSYELNAGGDHESIRRWLAEHEARECGSQVATFHYEYERDLDLALALELRQVLHLVPGDRIYLIFKDPEDGEVTGRFIYGQRSSRPDFYAGLEYALSQLN